MGGRLRASELKVVSKPWPAPPHSFETQINGTAFAIDSARSVTAAHLISQYIDSRYTDLVLMDANGKEYLIAKVLSYSDVQDFAVLK